MLPYYKRYTIYVSAIAIALPVIASTVWPLITGQMMGASITGLVGMFALFVLGLFLGYSIFGRRADAETERLLAKYNDDCDPQALVDEGAKLADAISFPCDQSGSWYLGYYAQALMDLGRTEEAKAIKVGIERSMEAAKKPAAKVGILANLLPLIEKADGAQAALDAAKRGLGLCEQAGGDGVSQIEDYFKSQMKVLEAEVADDPSELAKLSAAIVESQAYPMRIRVEYAWKEASAQYRLDDLSGERQSLRFVADHGGKLALAGKARERLGSLGK